MKKYYLMYQWALFFGTELCNLVGLHILHRLKSIYIANKIGFYREDSLVIIEHFFLLKITLALI